MGNIDLTAVCVAVITVLAAVMVRMVIPYIKEKLRDAKLDFEQNFSNEELEKIRKWVEIAVKAAEMIYKESGMGEKKKEYVVKFITEKIEAYNEYLEENGFVISMDEINNIIESAVLDMKNEMRK